MDKQRSTNYYTEN